MVTNKNIIYSKPDSINESPIPEEWNKTETEIRNCCIHQLFAEQASRTPDSVAVTCGNNSLTYRQLDTKTNQLANHLISLGVGPDILVGVCVERSIEMIIGILGILKAGGAYVPLDPEYPQERLEYMIENSNVSVLLTLHRMDVKLPQGATKILLLDTDWKDIEKKSSSLQSSHVSPDNLIYIIYTSGSTGKPKGSMLYHKGFVNLIHWYTSEFTFGPGANVLLMTSTSFDLTQKNIFAPLTAGGHLVLLDSQIFDAGIIQKTIEDQKITSINCTPSAFNGIIAKADEKIFNQIASLRQIFLGGEPIIVSRLTEWLNNPHCQATVINSYGPTECTDVCAYYRLSDYERYAKSTVPIGRPICNTQLYILDSQLHQLPLGEEGEICIGGAGVGAGYINRPDLNSEKFVQNPFANDESSLLYKTGDRGRYLPDGNIEYLGRIDQQVKIRGFRIEPGEIEALLEKHSDVSETVVIGLPDKSGENRLVAYLVLHTANSVSVNELRTFLQHQLPDYMLPTAWVFLEKIPLTPNGKIDRKALPAPEKKRPPISQNYVRPRSFLEEALVAIWQNLLGFEKIGINDPFFELGGTSIQAIQFIAEISQILHQRIPIVNFFDSPTVSRFAVYLGKNFPVAVQNFSPSAEQNDSSDKTPSTIGIDNDKKSSPNSSNLPSSEPANADEIAIIGMSGRFPRAENIYEFWELLQNGIECSSAVTAENLMAAGLDPSLLNDQSYVPTCFPLEDFDGFDADFFGYSPREVEVMDPQHRLFLETAWTVLEDAGYNLMNCRAHVGIFGGVARNGYIIHNIASHAKLRDLSGEYQYLLGNEKDFPVTRVAYKLNLTGPAVNVQTACSSSGVALHLACQSLFNGDCEMAIVGGCRVMVPHRTGYLHVDGGTLSRDGHLRVFDRQASGMVRGSGGGCLLLKRLQLAINDRDNIYAVIKSSAINNDGLGKAGFTAPSIKGQEEVVTKALAMSGVEAETIRYVETHGTGTNLGDPIEVAALTQAYRNYTDKNNFCAIGSVKTNIGHLDAGSCVAGIIKTALALKNKKIPPSLNFQEPNPQIDFENSPFFVNTALSDWPESAYPCRAGVSSFGLGGTNAHIILEEAPLIDTSSSSRAWQLIVLSAKTKNALKTSANNLCDFLEKNNEINLADMSYTLQVGRQHFQNRLYALCRDANDLLNILTASDTQKLDIVDNEGIPPRVYFMFPGQGSQHINMGRDLYDAEPLFKDSIDDCAEKLRSTLGLDIRNILFPSEESSEESTEKLTETWITQPALFMVEYALAKLWLSWGIEPVGLIGHSIGEFAAACLAGVFSLDDALKIVSLRGRLMFEQPRGHMLAVRLSENELNKYKFNDVSLAVCNAPDRSVLSGPPEAIDRAKELLEKNNISSVKLRTSHAFHSAMMEPVLPQFIDYLQSFTLNTPKIPFISNCTGTWITDDQATDPHYWANQLRQPVLFSQGIQTILINEGSILLEVGPSNVLSVLAKQHTGKIPPARIITSWDHAANEHSALKCTLSALGKLWQFNSNINWNNFYSQETRRRISLPGYPFERKRFWIEPATAIDQQKQIPISTKPQNQMPAQQEILMAPNKSPAETSTDNHAPLSRKANIALELRKLLKELSGMDLQESDDASSFLSLGLDSLFLTQVIGKLKKNFNVELKFRQLLEEYTDINSLTDCLDQKIPPEMFRPSAALSPQQNEPSKESPLSLPTSNITLDQPLPIPMEGAGNSVLENVITQQLQIMQQQLNMLRGQVGNPTQPETMASPAHFQPEKKITTEQSNPAREERKTSQPVTASPKAFGASVRIEKSSQTTFTQNQQKFFADFCKKYIKKTRRSKEYTISHRPHLADPRVVSGFNPLIKELVYPIVVNRSSGSRVWDIDGNEYIDMVNGFGANLLGHSPEFITEAIHKQLLQGIEIGPQTPLAGEVAELICEFSGLERAVFCNTGSEAVLGAMRISRTVTGRDKIVVFTDDYHGMFDEVIVRGTNSLKSVPAASGIPFSSVENMLVLEYGKDESLEIITQHADDIAAILVEPVQSRNLNLQPREFLHRLRDVTLEKEIVLIFDEVITGFRSHLHGAQAYFGIHADIATYGKIVGGGMPIGVIAGKSKYMDALDGGMWQYGDASVPEAGVTYFAGTFVRHPLAMAAAKATLEYLKKCGASLQEELNNKTARFVADMKDFLAKCKAPINILHFSSALQFAFTEDTVASNLFHPMLRDKGIHIFPGRTWFFTTSHDQSDFAAVAHALQETVRELQQEGFLSGDPTPAPALKPTAGNPLGLSTTPPVPTARLGKTPDGNPAWFIPDPQRPGKYMKFE